MKRSFSIILCMLLALVLFSGCVKSTTVITFTEFESTVTVTKDDLKITGNLIFKNSDEMKFTVNEPEELKNIVVSYSYGDISLTGSDLTLNISDISMGNDIFSPLFEALKFICEYDLEVEKTGVNEINLPEGEINLTFSSDDMKIVSIEKDGVIYNFQ